MLKVNFAQMIQTWIEVMVAVDGIQKCTQNIRKLLEALLTEPILFTEAIFLKLKI